MNLLNYRLLPLLCVSLINGCGARTSEPGTDSKTSFWITCKSNAQCNGLSCICGRCGVACKTDSACSNLGEAASCEVVPTDCTAPAAQICQPDAEQPEASVSVTPTDRPPPDVSGIPQPSVSVTSPLPPAEESFKLLVDAYQQPCTERTTNATWCYRVSEDNGMTWRQDNTLEWSAFSWGFQAVVQGHRQVEVGSTAKLVVDTVASQTAVTRPILVGVQLDPGSPTAASLSLIASDAGQFIGGPAFTCQRAGCTDVQAALDKGGPFVLRAALNSETLALRVQVLPYPYLAPPPNLDALRAKQEKALPSRYVVKICGTGFNPHACTLSAVSGGNTVAQETEGIFDHIWSAVPEADRTNPFKYMFEMLSYDSNGGGVTNFSMDSSSTYVQDVYDNGALESGGQSVSCFEADSLDLEKCRM